MTTTVVVEKTGERLDRYVAENCPGLSRTRAQKLIEEGQVKVNGLSTKPSLKLSAGDHVVISIPPPAPTHLQPEDIPIHVIYEDDDVIVVDKPAGLTVHPAPGHPAHTLVNAVLAHLGKLPEAGNTLRPGVVHRLDKDTSGVMLLAKNPSAHADCADDG